MKVYRILAAAAAAVLLLAGCTREMKTAIVADEGKVPMPGGYDAALSYSYSMEYVTGGIPKQVMSNINEHIVSYGILYESEEALNDVPAACRQWVETLVAGYEADTEDFAEEWEADQAWIFNWSFDIDGSFETACKARNWQTYGIASEDYTGGAHGSYATIYKVFDMKTGGIIREEDFIDTDADELLELIYDNILENLDEELWDAIYEVPTLNGNFRVDENGVTWVYNPYEIGPYVLGALEAFVSWEDLSPYLLAAD